MKTGKFTRESNEFNQGEEILIQKKNRQFNKLSYRLKEIKLNRLIYVLKDFANVLWKMLTTTTAIVLRILQAV